MRQIGDLTSAKIADLVYEIISGEWSPEDVCKGYGCTCEQWLEWRKIYMEGAGKAVATHKSEMERKG